MKAILLLVVCMCLAISTYAADTYDTKYDTIDIDNILSNNRVLGNYIKCLMEQAPCTKEGRQLKKDLPDALETNCEKCSGPQKKIVRKACNHIREKRPDDWKKLQAKYDPAGKFTDSFKKFLDEE